MSRVQKQVYQRGRLDSILEKLKDGIVIVEGKHDVDTLRRLGISSIPYGKFMSTNMYTHEFQTEKTFYLMMDADKGGEDKGQKILSLLTGFDNYVVYNTELGRSFLKLLGITSVEQAYGKVQHIMTMSQYFERI